MKTFIVLLVTSLIVAAIIYADHMKGKIAHIIDEDDLRDHRVGDL